MKRRAFPFFFLFGIFLAGGSSVASEVDAHEANAFTTAEYLNAKSMLQLMAENKL
jgi:hypothetical protein